ncbi:hypothetical protein COW83_00640 [Candidatus Collierbacteria bacterium CG22_combo_CG10-13_8_21_14_all_43_12]|uniref:Uncharacterized protein n=1 Tax=Candidatus Collierbacteria bacterium CG22_combo_CG10-13_8_21_14_all_43_12 TaxID=1974537 RepID=A0A2H0DVD6_9BACT|nr:MAG: hypothetical protein COW83_00640 [Candidatus Collierbacteria bacterium CG22_combo_CG10-13_8_21_14_all_43_12]
MSKSFKEIALTILLLLLAPVVVPGIYDPILAYLPKPGEQSAAAPQVIVINAQGTPLVATQEFTAEDAATAVAEYTPEPGEDSGAVATLIPWTTVLDLGDASLLETSAREVFGTMGYDLNITSTNTRLGMGVWCEIIFSEKWGKTWNPSVPNPTQLQNGTIKEDWQSRDCQMWIVEGELVAGIPSVTLSQLKFYSIEEINGGAQPKPPYAVYREVPSSITNTESKTVTEIETLDVVLYLEYGFFGASVQSTNQVMHSLEAPLGVITDLANFNAWVNKNPGWTSYSDKANTMARWLANYDLIAPIGDDGSRSTANLDRLLVEMKRHFSEDAPPGSAPWPYTRLKADVNLAAQKAGFSEISIFKVELVSPIKDQWVKIESIVDDDPGFDLVIDPADLDFNAQNFYPMFRNEIDHKWDWLPSWVTSHPEWGIKYQILPH